MPFILGCIDAALGICQTNTVVFLPCSDVPHKLRSSEVCNISFEGVGAATGLRNGRRKA
jgi:hypothetical protein